MSDVACPRPLHHRHRLSRLGQDDADPPCARQRQWAAAGGDRQRVRRCRHRRRDPQRLRRCRLPRGEHRRARQWLPVLHGGRRVRAGARPDPRARAGRRAHRHRDVGARSAEASGAGVPLAGDQEPRHRRRRGRGGRRRGACRRPGRAPTSRRCPRQRQADTALDHDDPIEEVFEDQIACADLVVLNKRDLLDAPGIGKAIAAIQGALPRAVRIVTVADGKVDPAALLGLGVGTEDDIENRKTHHDDELDHDHDDFDSFVVALPEIGDPAAHRRDASPRVAEAHNVLRMKGFLRSRASRCASWCRRSARASAIITTGPGAQRRRGQGNLVVIGLKGLDREAIDQGVCADRPCICSRPHRRASTTSSNRSISARRRATSWSCLSPIATLPVSLPAYAAETGLAPRACASRICAICAIRCRSISGSTRSRATPK